MKIVTRKSDGAVIMVADCADTPQPAQNFEVHDCPGWDWSLVDMSGVDTSQPDWIGGFEWNGTTLVRKT
jgi:hypothetical protein